MAITISGTLAIDETSGTQNAADGSDSTGNDIASGAGILPSEFDAVLLQEGASSATATGFAVSGATADNSTGTDMITNLGADVTNLAFTDSAGNALDGDVAKFGPGAGDFLTTTDGTKIFLYTSTFDDNVVLGRKGTAGGLADPAGAVVFAAYLDTHTVAAGDAGATGAKVWMVEYQTILHGTAGSTAAAYDDARFLVDPLNVSVSNRTDFVLEGAPSGQNLFLMFGDGTPSVNDVTIVVTAEHPANQSTGASITTGQTVNTGQGGGGTTLGNTNQMVDPQEGLVFTFVKGADTNYTVPLLDQNEADVEANIAFTSLHPGTGATFSVVQLQQDSKAELQISAFNTDLETGTAYIDGLGDADDVLVNINYVKVSTFTKQGSKLVAGPTHEFTSSGLDLDTGVTVTFNGDGTVKLVGLEANDKIEYHTGNSGGALTHSRVLITNTGDAVANASTTNAAFDIGGFSLIDANKVATPFQALSFQDDGPTAAIVLGTREVIVDETAGNDNDDVAGTTAFDPDGPGGNAATTLATLFAITGAGTDTNLPQYALSGGAVVASTGSSGGTDGLKSTVFSLAIAGGVNGTDSLLDTTDGKDIRLFKEGDLIVGRYDTANGTVDATDPAAFAIAIDQGGRLAVAQYVSLKHPTAGDGTTPAGSHDERIDLINLVNAVVTVTDNDNDTATATTGVGDKINFDDDGPTAGIALGANEVTIDESAGSTDNDVAGTITFDKEGDGSPVALSSLFAITGAGTDTNLPQYALSGGAVVASTGSSGGTDGLKSTVFSLAVVGGNGTDSQLDTTDGKNILLFKEGDLIVGRYDTANGAVTAADPAAFAIAIDQGGRLAVAQYVSLKHPTAGNGTLPVGSYDEPIDLSNLVNAVVTVTDNDNDTASTSTAIGDKINFDDDGPSVTFGNLIGTGSVNPQYGYWTSNAGTDGILPGVTGLDINVTGFTIVRPNNTTATGTATLDPLAGSPDGSGNFLFSGTLSGDFDNNAGTTDPSIHYFLTALANGSYKLDLVEGFVSSTSTVSTIDGLTAGGPDPVQTLTPGAGLHPPAPLNDKQIVFFNVLAADTESQVESMIGGTPDLTEAQLEGGGFGALLGAEAMNVSTSGIGVGNNNLNGNDTSSSGLDESFVANPEFDVSKVKVFIDNSVSGYTPATESLLYTIYYTDGSTSGTPIKVLAGDIIAGAKANEPVHFDVQATAGKTIDAIQLTMDSGTVKIPYMEFVTEIAAPANDLQLAFEAILTDGDGDTASSSFLANLYANELAGSFNFVLTGTSGADAFNIDLPDLKNTYQANAFTPGVDKLVLLGANSYTITPSGANSVLDITETAGGQHTSVEVVGVTVTAADILTIV